ncbi:hypothetical protein [Agaribacter flavus]|uniref:Uncharacterized protein n=1 Tax=Agaribacter flavus TaxID=1902781 RepID=A0ABV7FWF9_9ALTE
MAEAMYQSRYAIPDSAHGLKWLIKKLNNTRQKERKLNVDYI